MVAEGQPRPRPPLRIIRINMRGITATDRKGKPISPFGPHKPPSFDTQATHNQEIPKYQGHDLRSGYNIPKKK